MLLDLTSSWIGLRRLAAGHHTPQGLHSGAGSRAGVIVSAQPAGRRPLVRTTAVVQQDRKRSRSVRPEFRISRVPALAGTCRRDPHPGRATPAALFPVFEEPEVRPKKGLNARVITAGSCAAGSAAIEGASSS